MVKGKVYTTVTAAMMGVAATWAAKTVEENELDVAEMMMSSVL